MPSEAALRHAPHEAIDTTSSSIALLTGFNEPCRVLIVDDDELTGRQIGLLLLDNDYEVCFANSGKAALRILESQPCQIVVTDWQMPDMDGLALCREIRRTAEAGYTYVLVLTVCNGSGDSLTGLSAGADDYIVKGASDEDILAHLQVGRRITHLERALRTSNAENRRISVTDALTGVRNRRFLMKYLPREIDRARRNARSLGVLSCDIDFFKRINDRYGHEVGDQVLQGFVTRATTCLRQPMDWIARSGGEEFVLVLPTAGLHNARRIAARLRTALADSPIPTTEGPIHITVSIGVTALETYEELGKATAAALLRVADECLYESKKRGRDRATVSSISNARGVFDAQH